MVSRAILNNWPLVPPSGFNMLLNGFSRLKAKLAVGANAVIFVNGDSTAYSEYGPYYKFAVMLGNLYNATVIVHRWAEWTGAAANGPKEYSAPVVLRAGSSQVVELFLAALPGQVIGCMFESSRKQKAIDAIPTPDVAITHHGHNMISFETPGSDISIGRGLFWAGIGMISWQWEGVAQVITTQNPLRDDTTYSKLYNSITGVAAVFPSITMVDTNKKFTDANKNASLYRDNVHPSDTSGNSSGAQLQADALMVEFNRARVGEFSTESWMELPIGSNLFVNGDLSNWTGSTPANFSNVAGNVTSKDFDPANIFPGSGASYSAKVAPPAANGQFAKLSNSFDATERASMSGKSVTAIMLVKANPLQKMPVTSFVTLSLGSLRTFTGGGLLWDQQSGKNVGGWMPIVYAGLPCDANNSDANSKFALSPAFGGAAPPTLDPAWLQRAVIIEGSVPRLGLVRP
jgi:hypothetical protein